MVNPDVGTVSFFNAATKTKSGSASFGATSQPEGVAIHPDNTTAFVLLRRAQQLAKVTAINTTTPAVATTRAPTCAGAAEAHRARASATPHTNTRAQ